MAGRTGQGRTPATTSAESFIPTHPSLAACRDPMFHAVIDQGTGDASGLAAFLRIDCANGVIEVGHINFGPALQRTCASEKPFTS